MERLEIVDSGRRRRFSKEKKLQIVAESYLEAGLCATTARRQRLVEQHEPRPHAPHFPEKHHIKRICAPGQTR